RGLHAVHDGDLPRPRGAPLRDELLRARGPSGVPVRLGDSAHGRPPRRRPVPPPLRALRAVRGRAHLRAHGVLPSGHLACLRLARGPLRARLRRRMMAPGSAEIDECLGVLERALESDAPPALDSCPASVLDAALRELVRRHGAAAAPLLRAPADRGPSKDVRKVAKLAIYRLAQAGVAVPPSPAATRPVIARPRERAVRAWLSGIDGSGSRAVWLVFEGGLGGGLSLCSLI